MSRPKILIVEDHESLVEIWKMMLGDEVEVLGTQTLTGGEKMFKENQDLKLIVMDCCVPGAEPNSMGLVKKIRESDFQGPIIAKSSDREFCKVLRAAGADYSASADTAGEVPELVLKLLKKTRED